MPLIVTATASLFVSVTVCDKLMVSAACFPKFRLLGETDIEVGSGVGVGDGVAIGVGVGVAVGRGAGVAEGVGDGVAELQVPEKVSSIVPSYFTKEPS
jgi:hypothetical protein